MSRNKKHRPNGAAAEGGRPIGGAAEGGASVFFVSAHAFLYIMNIYGYSLLQLCNFCNFAPRVQVLKDSDPM